MRRPGSGLVGRGQGLGAREWELAAHTSWVLLPSNDSVVPCSDLAPPPFHTPQVARGLAAAGVLRLAALDDGSQWALPSPQHVAHAAAAWPGVVVAVHGQVRDEGMLEWMQACVEHCLGAYMPRRNNMMG